MDEKDALLISLLRKDARRPIVALARAVALSRSATQERLAKLTATGAISKFTIVEGGANNNQQAAHMLLRLEKGFKCAQIVPKLKAIHSTTVIHSVAGLYDLVVRVDSINMAELEAARASIAAISGIADVTTLVALERQLN